MYIIITITIIAALIAALVYQGILENKRRETAIQDTYGKRHRISDALDRLEWISLLYQLEKKHIPANSLVDDITWNDLDMDSVFGLIDHTDSFAGEQCLYSKLHDLSAGKEEIEELERRISLTDSNETLRRSIRKKLFILGKTYGDYDLPMLIDQLGTYKLKKPWVYYLLSGALIASGVCAAVFRTPLTVCILLGIYIFNLVVHITRTAKLDAEIKALSGVGRLISTAISIDKECPGIDPKAREYLAPLKKAAKNALALEIGRPHNNAFNEFSLISAYMLGPFMIDFIIYDRIISDLCGKLPDCFKAYRYVGETDCALAISSFRKSTAHCVPVLTENRSFSFEGLVNPLLERPVPNDLTFKKNIIITGSNASGKSTFVKSVSINLILGQTLNTCTAVKAVIPRCGVMTSMAVRDDIISGESYYICEIKYLKRMIDNCSDDKLMFLAIDEILKGTNTVERIAASKAVIDYLSDKNCMLMTATHDLELAGAFQDRCDNYHFSEIIDSNDVVFDYIIHDGISNSSNAIKLLAAMHFPSEIINKSFSYLQDGVS